MGQIEIPVCINLVKMASQFQKYRGFISHGGDICREQLTLVDAMEKASRTPNCMGFCFKGPVTDGVVEVLFKDKWDNMHGSKEWTSFRPISRMRLRDFELAGVPLTELPSAMANRGYSLRDIRAAGYSPSDAQALGHSIDEIREAGYAVCDSCDATTAALMSCASCSSTLCVACQEKCGLKFASCLNCESCLDNKLFRKAGRGKGNGWWDPCPSATCFTCTSTRFLESKGKGKTKSKGKGEDQGKGTC